LLAGDQNAFAGLTVPVTNVFFPGSIKLFGPEKTPYLEYARMVIARAAAAGVRLMVLGSGASRTAPAGLDPLESEAQFVSIAEELDGIAQSHGMRIAPESLGREETNVGTDLGRLARALNERGVGYTADAFHVLREWRKESSDPAPSTDFWREKLPFPPSHVHFASERARTLEPDDPHLVGFFSRLRELGYDGRVSFEGELGGMGPGELLDRARQLIFDF
jgi:sugar phosphate isomerase/epimerase